VQHLRLAAEDHRVLDEQGRDLLEEKQQAFGAKAETKLQLKALF
jgi:hypothetical protein